LPHSHGVVAAVSNLSPPAPCPSHFSLFFGVSGMNCMCRKGRLAELHTPIHPHGRTHSSFTHTLPHRSTSMPVFSTQGGLRPVCSTTPAPTQSSGESRTTAPGVTAACPHHTYTHTRTDTTHTCAHPTQVRRHTNAPMKLLLALAPLLLGLLPPAQASKHAKEGDKSEARPRLQ
jgi:hypothetical protein